MKRVLILVLALSIPVLLYGQQPVPELSLTANGQQNVNVYPGWPLIVHTTIMNSSRFPKNGTPTQLVIAPNGAPWTSAIQFTAIDASGQAHQWPLNLIGTPSDPALTLAPTSYVRFTLQMAPADVSSLAPGTYQLTAALQVINSSAWNGIAESRPVTVRVGPEPVLPAVEQARKALLIAEFETNNGDLNGALATVHQLLQVQPTNPAAMTAAANLLELLGYPELAFSAADDAFASYVPTSPSYEPPANLLSMKQRLFTKLTTTNVSESHTNISASSAEVTFSPADQTVTLSATVSGTSGPVDGGTVTFSITGAGNPITSSPVAAGNASAVFTIPGGTQAGSYPIVASYNGTALFLASGNSGGVLKIDKATPAINWSNPASITDGAALSATQLNATANVPGAFAYNPPAGTVLPAGSSQTLSVLFTPADATDYNSVSANVSISVIPAVLTITPNNATRQYGQTNPPLNNVTYSGFVNGDTPASLSGTLLCMTSATSMSSVGSYAITCSGLTSPNYSITFALGTLMITPSPLTVAANNNSRPYGANNPALTGLVAGLQNADPITANFTTTAVPASPVGTYPITPVVLDLSNRLGNYTVSLVNGTLSVLSETTSLAVTLSPASISVGQSATATVTLTAPDMVIPMDPSVLGPVTLSSPVVSDTLTNSGVCTPVPSVAPGIASCVIMVTAVEPNGRTLSAMFPATANLARSTGTGELIVTAALQSQQVCIASDFRNVAVPGGSYLWFNSIFKVRDVTKQLIHVSFFKSTVQFQYTDAVGNPVTVNQGLPDAKITIDPNATVASTSFDAINNVWMTTIPWDLDDNAFLTGMPWLVPSAGLPADVEPVTVCGTFASDVANVDIGWRWAAAAYSSFSRDNTTLGVEPMDTDHDNASGNHDRAGTPENFKQFAIPGARSKGGKNYTGSYSRSAVIE